MTYPPQPPGPPGPPGPYGRQPGPTYGQRPSPYGPPPGQGPYGQQPPPFGPPPPTPPHGEPYQGHPGAPDGDPPKRRRTNLIIAIVVIALLVLGGGGLAVFFLTKDDSGTPNPGTAQPGGQNPGGDDGSAPQIEDSPAAVQQAYVEAYEAKRFTTIVESACRAYKDKFGTDTKDLEKRLQNFDVKASADGEPTVDGSSAVARIDLELTQGSEIKPTKIQIKIIKESGRWRFCGEGEVT